MPLPFKIGGVWVQVENKVQIMALEMLHFSTDECWIAHHATIDSHWPK